MCPVVLRNYSNLLTKYQNLIASDQLRSDSYQLEVVKKLVKLQHEVQGYEPPSTQSSFLSKVTNLLFYDKFPFDVIQIFSSRKPTSQRVTKGIYMYGSVGINQIPMM